MSADLLYVRRWDREMSMTDDLMKGHVCAYETARPDACATCQAQQAAASEHRHRRLLEHSKGERRDLSNSRKLILISSDNDEVTRMRRVGLVWGLRCIGCGAGTFLDNCLLVLVGAYCHLS